MSDLRDSKIDVATERFVTGVIIENLEILLERTL